MTAFDSFRFARWIRTANLVVQAVLFLTLFGGLNYLAGNHSWRFDLTRYRRYSLSPETLAYLRELRSPVRIVLGEAENAASPEIRGLLREYAYATESSPDGRVTVEYLDIFQSRRRAEQLGLDQAGEVLVICGDHPIKLTDDDLYQVEAHERRAFVGEQVITGAILTVSDPERKKVYFLTGHGELRPDDVDSVRGLSTARDQLRLRNYDVDVVDLSAARRIPPDASLLIAVAPQSPFSAHEKELLRGYLGNSAGRLILFLSPGYPHGLNDLLLDWGVTVDDVTVLDTGAENMTEDGDLIVRDFPHPNHPGAGELRDPPAAGRPRQLRPAGCRPRGRLRSFHGRARPLLPDGVGRGELQVEGAGGSTIPGSTSGPSRTRIPRTGCRSRWLRSASPSATTCPSACAGAAWSSSERGTSSPTPGSRTPGLSTCSLGP